MKCEVTLYVAGTVFKEQVHARDYQEARQVALARNPNAKIVGVTAKFWCGKYGSTLSDLLTTAQQKSMMMLYALSELLFLYS